MDRIGDEQRGVVDAAILEPGGELGRQLVHGMDHLIANLQRVGPGRLEDADRHRVLAIQTGAQGVVAGAELQPGDILESENVAIGAGLEHDVAELRLAGQAPLGVDQGQEVAVRHRFAADLPGGDLHVLVADRRHHVAGGEAVGGDPVRVEPHAHGVVAAAEQLRLAHAGDARQLVAHVQAGVVAQVESVVAVVRRDQVHHHQKGRRLLLGGHALAAHRLGQARQGLADPVLHPHRGLLGVGAGAEGDGHLQHPVGTGDRLVVHHPFDTGDRLLERRGDGVGDLLGVGAGVDRADQHRGRHHLRILADRQVGDRDRAEREHDDRQHRGEDRAVDEETRNIHALGLLCGGCDARRLSSFPGMVGAGGAW